MLSKVNKHFLASIAGEKGTGKDLLACEIARRFMDASVYKFYSNQFNVWNDPLYVDRETYLRWRQRWGYKTDNIPERDKYPDVLKRVLVITEAGDYLREMKIFKNLVLFARKMKQIFLLPSTWEPHANLQVLTLFPIWTFKETLGIDGGIWAWKEDTGRSRSKSGFFIFIPGWENKGVYDTYDFSESASVPLKAVEQEIEIDQLSRGRSGIQTMEGGTGDIDMEHQLAIQKRYQQNLISLQKQRR